MDRRRFLVGVAGLAATLTGCDGNAATALRLRSLKNSIPQQLLGEFHRQFKTAIDLKPDEQLSTLFSHLQTWKQQPKPSEPVPDLVTLGDYWLSTAIRQGLIQPIEAKALPQWNQLPDLWQAIATRNDQGLIDPKGKIWGAPYRWGGTVIVYRADIFRDRRLQPPTDWADLWRPELKRRISLLDQPRETIGLTLKKLGKSYNLQDLRSVPNLEAELEQLHQQAKFYSSDHYLQPLLLGDTWVAVGWSNEVFQTQRRNNELAAVFPRSGTALWADLWVRPAVAAGDRQTLLTDWVNFLWQPETAQQLSRLSYGASPMLQALKDAPDIQAFLPDPEARRRSEFLQPLAEASATLYRQLWERVRRR
jgi:putative spermidine/putrescine transport system substrate-binding protein